jgi:RecB family endonuclease NucS
MRIVIADCEAVYEGRSSTTLARAKRMLMFKADGTVLVHSDSLYKPLNWMGGGAKTRVEYQPGKVQINRGDERLTVWLHRVYADFEDDLGDEPGLQMVGQEAEMQVGLAAHPDLMEPGLRLVRREYPTAVGPADLLCVDPAGNRVVVEVKRRVAPISGVDQLLRYIHAIEQQPTESPATPIRGIYVAPRFHRNAERYAESRGITCCALTYQEIYERVQLGRAW